MKTIVKKTTALALVSAVFLSTACATIEGVGKDVETAGEIISEKARAND